MAPRRSLADPVPREHHAQLHRLARQSSPWTTSWIRATAAWMAGRGACRVASPTQRRSRKQINYAFVNRGLSYESRGHEPQRAGELRHGRRAWTPRPGGRERPTTRPPPRRAGRDRERPHRHGHHASSDAPFGIQGGYIFNAVLQAGGTVRNYGFLVNNIGSIERRRRRSAIRSPLAWCRSRRSTRRSRR